MHVTNTNRLAFRVSVSVVNFAWVTLPLCLTIATIATGLIMRYPCPHPCPHPHLHPHRWIELDCYLFSPRVTQIVIKRIENIHFSRCRSTIARLIASPTSRRCIKLVAWDSHMIVGSACTIHGSKLEVSLLSVAKSPQTSCTDMSSFILPLVPSESSKKIQNLNEHATD